MISLVVAAFIMTPSTPDPGLPTTPPALPTYVVKGDGTRIDCTPDYRFCWSE